MTQKHSSIQDTANATRIIISELYNKGNIIAYLEADKKEDLACYKSKEDFKSWFAKYVLIK